MITSIGWGEIKVGGAGGGGGAIKISSFVPNSNSTKFDAGSRYIGIEYEAMVTGLSLNVGIFEESGVGSDSFINIRFGFGF